MLGLGQACGQMEPANKLNANSSSSNGNASGDDPFDTSIGGQPGSGAGQANAYGYADPVAALGTIGGEAKNPTDPSATVTVYFFVNGPSGTGTTAGTVLANQPGLGNTGGANRFAYQLPPQFRNGTIQTLYAYAFINGVYQQLGGSPQDYAAYTPTAAGQNYYSSTLQSQFQNRCAQCHAVAYNSQYASLLGPTKFKGGTAASNDLINYASGGNGHGGGNHCPGGKNAGLCAQIQQWWNLEFP